MKDRTRDMLDAAACAATIGLVFAAMWLAMFL
jgi:hypothetical protein